MRNCVQPDHERAVRLTNAHRRCGNKCGTVEDHRQEQEEEEEKPEKARRIFPTLEEEVRQLSERLGTAERCVFVCVCVCARARVRARACVCLCVYIGYFRQKKRGTTSGAGQVGGAGCHHRAGHKAAVFVISPHP